MGLTPLGAVDALVGLAGAALPYLVIEAIKAAPSSRGRELARTSRVAIVPQRRLI